MKVERYSYRMLLLIERLFKYFLLEKIQKKNIYYSIYDINSFYLLEMNFLHSSFSDFTALPFEMG